ncbi:MAG TPA: GNAT family N-acetyltransferase [Bacteroidales bacterium]|nr:GNAT family N-acetyltransferase [Bacteroidales bacterium]
MNIDRITEIDDKTLNALQQFIPELTNEIDRVPSKEDLENVVSSPNNYLFVAEEENEIIGTLTLVFYRVPSGIKAWIEDVIVSDKARGKGVATALIWHAINIARENKAQKVDLSSSPWREAANNLYVKLGFEKRDSNMYRLYI